MTGWAAPGGPDAAIGQTVSRADGAYDLVLAGGREVTVMLEKPGYFAAHRLVAVPVRDHVHAPDVILLAPDATVTELEQGAGAMQVAEGSVEQDADGARRGVVMVPAGTTMSVSDGHGGLTPLLGPVHLRVTEFTVGAEGPAAMPGTLPPSVAYTYAVEVVSAHSPLQRAARADLQRPAASCSSRSASSR